MRPYAHNIKTDPAYCIYIFIYLYIHIQKHIQIYMYVAMIKNRHCLESVGGDIGGFQERVASRVWKEERECVKVM